MLWTYNQHSFTGGRLDKELMGRQDLEQYYKGCSELKNMTVRRQGYLSKRRGTDEVANLENLLGHVPNSETGIETPKRIGKQLMIPLVNERDSGYAILITDQKAYLLSSKGILTMGGGWSSAVPDHEYGDYAAEASAETTYASLPRYEKVPYSDDELGGLDYTQSGDTVFLVHRSVRPARLELLDGKLKYSEIVFSGETWKPPRITSVKAKDSSIFGDGAEKTIYYVATYVKDGVESAPSLSFSYTYKRPWGDTAVIEITCDKGANETEPDYYNVYKKDASEYGLIATIGSMSKVTVSPEFSGTLVSGNKSYPSRQYTWDVQKYLNTQVPILDMGAGGIATATFSGGVNSGKKLTFEFDESEGVVISSVDLALDCSTLVRTGFVADEATYYHSGKSCKATLTTKGSDGTAKTFVAETSVSSAKDWALGANTTDSLTLSLYRDLVGGYPVATFDFKDKLEEEYPIFSSSATKTKSVFSVVKLEIEVFASSDNKTATDIYWRGIEFYSNYGNTNVFQDDYITPDLSVTPPQYEERFKANGDYPSVVSMHQQRLVLASSTNDPFTVWMSTVGDLYNFSAHKSIREDDALSFAISSTEFPEINHIVDNKDIMLFADSGEWKIAPVSGNTLTYRTVSANIQSAIGCSKTIKPFVVGDEILFANMIGQSLLATRYNFTSDGYETTDLTVLSQWIFRNNQIMQVAYKQHPDSTIECVLADGTVATLVYMKEHEVCAWSRHQLGGGWKARAICAPKSISNGTSEVLMLVELDGKYRLWRVRDDIPVRTDATVRDFVCLDGCLSLTSGTVPSGMIGVVVSNGQVLAEGAQITGETTVGLAFDSLYESVYPEAKGAAESAQMQIMNPTEAHVRVIDSGSFAIGAKKMSADYARDIVLPVSGTDGVVELCDADSRAILSGVNTRDPRIRVTSSTPWPLNILSVGITYQTEGENINGNSNGQ